MTSSWMEEFEQQLQRLEQSSSSTVGDLDETVAMAVSAIGCLSDHPITEFWIVTSESVCQIIDGSLVTVAANDGGQFPDFAESPTQWIKQSALPLFPNRPKASAPEASAHDLLICRSPLADSQQIIVGTSARSFHGSRPDVEDATLAVTTLLASRITQALLTTTTESSKTLNQLLLFANKLQNCRYEASVQQVIVQESGFIWPESRIVSVASNGNQHSVKAITGAGQINRQAAQIQAIKTLVDFIQQHLSSKNDEPDGQICWIERSHLETLISQTDSKQILGQLLDDYQATGVSRVGVMSIHCHQQHVLTILVESNDHQSAPPSVESQWRDLIQAAVSRTHHNSHQRKQWKRLSWLKTAGILVLLIAVSFLIPMDFELTANGQLVASGRRSLFASESGTVAAVHFVNEQKVDINAPLVTLTNPELVQRASEIDGEIATTKAAVAAANARRTSRTAEGAAAEGQVLKQRLHSLEAERKLIGQRIDSLQIQAPFSGFIVRRDAVQDLTNRPLQRGQRIAELIPLEVDWQLQLHLPQSHSSYLQSALSVQKTGLPVRYIIHSESSANHSAMLLAIEQFVYSRNNELVQNATVDVQLSDLSNAKSGTSVSARIFCGRRSLGFVATRKLVEAMQYLKFAWWN